MHSFNFFFCFCSKFIVSTAILLLILLGIIIIIAIAFAGPRRVRVSPINGGKAEAQTSCGMVHGLIKEDGYVFLGIPYALPPTGERRWKASEKLNSMDRCWNGTYKAQNVSNYCWQRNSTNHTFGNEDCLYLDVYTPKVEHENPLPVVIMIGADTLSGPSPGIMVPSGKLAHVREVVYVRPNFR